jgi:hypothetical protein
MKPWQTSFKQSSQGRGRRKKKNPIYKIKDGTHPSKVQGK